MKKTKKVWCDNILIYGLGAIGGSIGLKIKDLGLAKTVYGISRTQESVDLAQKKGCIDQGSTNLDLVSKADFIIFAVPPLKVLEILRKIAPFLTKKVYLTDVSSVKGKVYYEIDKFINDLKERNNQKIKYIGSHPMAGTEKKGVKHSFKEMLDSAVTLITPFEGTADIDIRRMKEFWGAFGCRVKTISVDKHDEFTAFTSHFPHVLAFLMVELVASEFKADKVIKLAIGGSFKDMTRVTGSDPELWSEIFMMNSENIAKVLNIYKKNIADFETLLETKDHEKITEFLKKSQKHRNQLMG
ncbi:MAG: prephenate dehydrogenase [bacterium]|nr:prephenate dehydrogenase [bacterium]